MRSTPRWRPTASNLDSTFAGSPQSKLNGDLLGVGAAVDHVHTEAGHGPDGDHVAASRARVAGEGDARRCGRLIGVTVRADHPTENDGAEDVLIRETKAPDVLGCCRIVGGYVAELRLQLRQRRSRHEKLIGRRGEHAARGHVKPVSIQSTQIPPFAADDLRSGGRYFFPVEHPRLFHVEVLSPLAGVKTTAPCK